MLIFKNDIHPPLPLNEMARSASVETLEAHRLDPSPNWEDSPFPTCHYHRPLELLPPAERD